MSGSDKFRGVVNPYASPLTPPTASEPDVAGDSEEKSLRAFVGARADYYLNKWAPLLRGVTGSAGFNWAAFLLSGLWLPYRKMYKLTAVLWGVVLFESIAEEVVFVGVLGYQESPASLDRIVTFVIACVCGAFGNSWYLAHARKIITEVDSDEPDREARLRTIAKRGGTSLASSLGLMILFFLLMAGMSFALEIMLHPNRVTRTSQPRNKEPGFQVQS